LNAFLTLYPNGSSQEKSDINGSNNWKKLDRLIDLGMGILMFLGLSGLVAWERILIALSSDGLKQFPIPQLSVLLLFLTLILIFLWRGACKGELQMLHDYFKGQARFPGRLSVILLTIGLAIFLLIMAYYSNDIVIFSAIFVCFKLLEIWGLWTRDRKLRETIKNICPDMSCSSKNLEAITEYYQENPQVQLAATILFLSFVSLLLGVLGTFETTPIKRSLFSASYIIILITICINEIIYYKWRKKRDKDLQKDYFLSFML
jgi:hypothetical protein